LGEVGAVEEVEEVHYHESGHKAHIDFTEEFLFEFVSPFFGLGGEVEVVEVLLSSRWRVVSFVHLDGWFGVVHFQVRWTSDLTASIVIEGNKKMVKLLDRKKTTKHSTPASS
jgi:hypothetical protein